MRHGLPATMVFAMLLAIPSGFAHDAHDGHDAHASHQEHGSHEAVGKVSFANSCAPGVQEDLARGVAMLHSFWYSAGERTFGPCWTTIPDAPLRPGASLR